MYVIFKTSDKMKTLNSWLKNLSPNSLKQYITETERFELCKYGVNAMEHLSLEKQVMICATFAAVFK